MLRKLVGTTTQLMDAPREFGQESFRKTNKAPTGEPDGAFVVGDTGLEPVTSTV